MPRNNLAKTSHEVEASPPGSIDSGVSSSAGPTLADTYDLVELVLLHLPYHDLRRCTHVSQTWRAFIKISAKLQRLLYKAPQPISAKEADPHFQEPSAAASAAIIPKKVLRDKLVLSTSQDIVTDFLARVTSEELCVDCANAALEDRDNSAKRVRSGFQGVRVPNGWPRELQEIYCEFCQGFHRHFRSENVHPLLGFLEDVDMCWRGEGGKLMMSVHFMDKFTLPRSCWDDCMAQEEFYARSLRKAFEVMESSGLQQDLFTKPIVTDLVLLVDELWEEDDKPKFIRLHNVEGVRLQQVLPALAFANKSFLKETPKIMEMIAPSVDEWDYVFGAGLRLEYSHRFPTKEDYAACVKGWPDTVQRFKDVASKADELMSGIEAWHWTEWPRK